MTETTVAKPTGATPAASPDAILQLGFGFWGSKTLLSAVELGVFTALAGTSAELEPLRARLGLHPRSARDFLDALVALGMLKRQDGRYANTPATEAFLDRAKPSYLGGILEMANARLFRFWADLTEGRCAPGCRKTRPRPAGRSSPSCMPTRPGCGSSPAP